jgi:hypothetical protein
MQPVELTLPRTIKIWWSITWRTCVISVIPWLVLVAVMFRRISTYMRPGPVVAGNVPQAPFVPFAFHHSPGSGLLGWLVSMLVLIAIQVLAIRWALKTRWSDFRLQALSEPQG